MDESKDHLDRRCPRLGGPVPFKYCRSCDEKGRPCFKVFDCWWETLDIKSYLKSNLSEDAFNKLIDTKPAPKITSLIELIEQAKNRLS